MRHQDYALTPIQITNAQPKARSYKLTDGAGLHLVVSTGGTKSWRYQYRYAGVRCDVGIGTFPRSGSPMQETSINATARCSSGGSIQPSPDGSR